MSDYSQGPGWWQASDGRWYPPETHPDYVAPPPAAPAVVPPPAAPAVVPPPAAPAAEPTAPTAGDSTSAPPAAPAAAIGQPAALPDAFAPAAGPATETGGRRRVPGFLLIAAVVVVVAGGAWVLLSSLLGSSAAAGAESPEEAFDRMMAAMDDEDGLGLISIADLEEFGLVRDAIEQVAGDDLAAGLPGGLDLAVTGLDGGPVVADFRELGGPGSGLVVAAPEGMRITLARTDAAGAGVVVYDRSSVTMFSTAEFDPGSEVALTVTPRGAGFEVDATGELNGERIDPEEPFRSDDVALEMVFVERDGRWFFSLGYTIAHLAVEAGAVDAPDWGRWRSVLEDERAGADSPTEAVSRAIGAFPELDLEEAMWVIDPIETRLLHDFLPQILDAIDEPVDDLLDSQTLEIVELELSEEIDGDRADVFLETIVLRSTDEFGDEFTLEFDGDWCYVLEDRFDSERGCLDEELEGLQRDLERELADSGFDAGIDLRDLLADRPFVRTHLRSGKWYVSPLDTMIAYGEAFAETFEGVAEEFQAQISEDGGVVPAETVAIDETRTVAVPAGGAAGLGIEFATDDFFEDQFDFELSLAAVTFEADGRVELQHGLRDTFGDEAEGRVRLRAGEPEQLVVVAEPELPRTRAVVFHNRGGEPVEVTVTVRAVEYLAVEDGRTEGGVIDEHGTPWMVFAGPDATLTGAAGHLLEFDRFPWFELDDAPTPEDGGPVEGLILVVGEPGAEFEVVPSG
ncbi:MAG: hypothetical protein ACE367_25910 [Acidimicrobiales bacterium]